MKQPKIWQTKILKKFLDDDERSGAKRKELKIMFEFIKKWCKKEEGKKENSMFKTYETELAGRKLVIETGKMAGLANRKRIS